MHTYVKQLGDVLVVKLCGRLYRDTAERFEVEMRTYIDQGAVKIVLDLENLHAMNSAGFRSLHRVSRHAEDNQSNIAFCACDGEILDCIECAGICTCCQTHNSLEEALTSIQRKT